MLQYDTKTVKLCVISPPKTNRHSTITDVILQFLDNVLFMGKWTRENRMYRMR